MKKHILLFIAATCTIAPSLFSEQVELKKETGDGNVSCVISYDKDAKGSFCKIPVEVKLTNKTDKTIYFDEKNIFKNLDLTARNPYQESLKERIKDFISETAVPIAVITGVLATVIAFSGWSANKFVNLKEEFSIPLNSNFFKLETWKNPNTTQSVIAAMSAFLGTGTSIFLLSKNDSYNYNGHLHGNKTSLYPPEVHHFAGTRTIHAWGSKKELEKKRTKLNNYTKFNY